MNVIECKTTTCFILGNISCHNFAVLEKGFFWKCRPLVFIENLSEHLVYCKGSLMILCTFDYIFSLMLLGLKFGIVKICAFWGSIFCYNPVCVR